MVFAYPVVKTILFIAQEASQAAGTFCFTSNSVHFANIWVCDRVEQPTTKHDEQLTLGTDHDHQFHRCRHCSDGYSEIFPSI